MDGDTAEEVHHEEQEEDTADGNAHDGCRGEDWTFGHLDDIDSCFVFLASGLEVQQRRMQKDVRRMRCRWVGFWVFWQMELEMEMEMERGNKCTRLVKCHSYS